MTLHCVTTQRSQSDLLHLSHGVEDFGKHCCRANLSHLIVNGKHVLKATLLLGISFLQKSSKCFLFNHQFNHHLLTCEQTFNFFLQSERLHFFRTDQSDCVFFGQTGTIAKPNNRGFHLRFCTGLLRIWDCGDFFGFNLTFLLPTSTYQRAFTRFRFFDVNQVAKGNAHEIRCNPTVRLDVHQVRIATSVRIFFKPETKEGKQKNRETCARSITKLPRGVESIPLLTLNNLRCSTSSHGQFSSYSSVKQKIALNFCLKNTLNCKFGLNLQSVHQNNNQTSRPHFLRATLNMAVPR